MNLHEFQAKQLFVKYNLPIPPGYLCDTPFITEDFFLKIGTAPWVVKCQVHAGGRGKSGGVKIVKTKKEVSLFVKYWLGKKLITEQTDEFGQIVNYILVENFINITKELYLALTFDRTMCKIVFIASNKGGSDIEKITSESSCAFYKTVLDILIGPQLYQGRELAFKLGLHGKQIEQFNKIFMGLALMFIKFDLTLAEINPIAITNNGDLICLDGKLSVDDNALFRQPKLQKICDYSQENPQEIHAFQLKLNYVLLKGNIGCMVNGAGLAMATMDIIKLYGGDPANFLDVGGNATKEYIIEGFKIILSNKKVKVILINIFGGIVRCDFIAESILIAFSKIINIPIVVRLEGNKSKLGIECLIKSKLNNIYVATSLTEAVKQVVRLI